MPLSTAIYNNKIILIDILETRLKVKELIYTSDYWDKEKLAIWNINSSSKRINYNFAECGIDFAANCRYDEDVTSIVYQIAHTWKVGTNIIPRLYYTQNQDETPNWLMEYRVYNHQDTIPATWVKLTGTDISSYSSSETINQLHTFGEIEMSNVTKISPIIDIKLYRDVDNSSGQFTSSDPYSGDALLKEVNLNYKIDAPGSRTDLEK